MWAMHSIRELKISNFEINAIHNNNNKCYKNGGVQKTDFAANKCERIFGKGRLLMNKTKAVPIKVMSLYVPYRNWIKRDPLYRNKCNEININVIPEQLFVSFFFFSIFPIYSTYCVSVMKYSRIIIFRQIIQVVLSRLLYVVLLQNLESIFLLHVLVLQFLNNFFRLLKIIRVKKVFLWNQPVFHRTSNVSISISCAR